MRAKPQSETVLSHVFNKNDGKNGYYLNQQSVLAKKKFFASLSRTNVLKREVGQTRLNNYSNLRIWKQTSFYLIRS